MGVTTQERSAIAIHVHVHCSNWIRSEDSLGIEIADILPRIRSHRVDVLLWFG